MSQAEDHFYSSLASLGKTVGQPLPVTLSPELIGLLSDQLYRSPSKAIEELVVNGFDAEAEEARVVFPDPSGQRPFIAVYDNGLGMTYDGLGDLWKVGRPKKRDDSLLVRKKRKQIGKFGIGKLATYAVADRVTYVTKAQGSHLAVTIDYSDFKPKPDATTTEVKLDVRRVDDLSALLGQDTFRDSIGALGLSQAALSAESSWTIVILEQLKSKARSMGVGRLRWVLRTAMPLGSDFHIYLNGEEIESSKEDYELIVDFDISELPKDRLIALRRKTGVKWESRDGSLASTEFPAGLSGRARVCRRTLAGKSAELGRSEGFFVYVRGRLVNEEDARFGLHELSHATLNRFRAEVFADDLDQVVTANRESMEDVDLYRHAQAVLNEIFNEARQRYEDQLEEEGKRSIRKREDKRTWVPERLVEYPAADALTKYSQDFKGSDADESWMYLTVDTDTDVGELTASLYSVIDRSQPYSYRYLSRGRADRLVQFDLSNSTFSVNQDHELVIAYADDPVAQRLLQDVVTSEAMLEVYLRDAGVSPGIIGEVLERRDLLLRGLADAHMFSLIALSRYISDSAAKKEDLEIAVVAGARALGFVAKHVSGSGEPDGIARFTEFPNGEQVMTLEAKSSADVPSAKDIDFAALKLHASKYNACGCLLVAPGYPGDDSGNSAQAAVELEISCWTVQQFASVIRVAEARQLSAPDILNIVRKCYAPSDVERAVSELLAEPSWAHEALYFAVVNSLRRLHGKLTQSPRNITMIAMEVAEMSGFEDVEESTIRQAVSALSSASKGAVLLRDNGDVILNVDYDELERRVQTLTGRAGSPRRRGVFGETDATAS